MIFTAAYNSDLAQQGFDAGALAFLLKSDANKVLVSAVRSLLAHKPFHARKRSHTYNANGNGLTRREQLVTKCVAKGYSNKAISSILGVSVQTIESHRSAAMSKIAATSTAGLVRYAVKTNLVEHETSDAPHPQSRSGGADWKHGADGRGRARAVSRVGHLGRRFIRRKRWISA
jgi:DNA-binding NarL/FixJ family response regulator